MTTTELAAIITKVTREADIATNAQARIAAIVGEKRAAAAKLLPDTLTPAEREMALDVISGQPAPLDLVIKL